MKPSEKLIIMLDLNNYNIDNLFLKKQIESEKSGNLGLHKCNDYSDLIICNYLYEENMEYTNRNPLTYRTGSWDEVESLDQLVITHPEVGKKLTIKDFLSIEIFSDTEKKNILNDVINRWLDEYKEARSESLKNIQESFFIITGENNEIRKPSRIVLVIGLLFTLFNTILFIQPQVLQIKLFSSFSNFVEGWSELLHDSLIYSVFGVFIILLFILYALQYFALLNRIRGVVREETSNTIKSIYKWDVDVKKIMSKQSKLLKKYVNLVLKKPGKSRFEMKKLIGLEVLLDKYRLYVKKVEKKYYWMINFYSKRIKRLRVTYISFILLNLIFIGLAFAIIRGLINV